GILDQVVFLVNANRRQRRRASHRMTVVSKSSIEHLVVEMLSNMSPHADSAQWDVTRSKSLRHANQIGNNLPVIDRKPLTGASKARHHFVGDLQNPVLVAQFPYAFKISIRRN